MRVFLRVGAYASMVLSIGLATNVLAHPGSGIVIDNKRSVFFQAGRAVWMIDAGGRLTKYSDKLGGHWMALDPEGSFARAELKLVERITPSGVKPALLVADGGAPVAVCRDGNLYYALHLLESGGVECGVTRISPDGKQSRFAPDFEEVVKKHDGITGLAAGPDGALYVACPGAILKLRMDGTFTTLVSPVVVKDCDEESKDRNPYLRGLTVDSRGTVYAAANGCHCVVKITPDGKIETLLKAERPWSPTGVAVFGEDVYVLEYTNSLKAWNEGEGWRPRVRKLSRDGRITTLATISPDSTTNLRRANDGRPLAPADSFVGSNAGDERAVASVKLCWCPPGKFMMGSPPNEPERRPGEDQVEVTLTKGFWTGKYEVTQGQWKRVVGKLPGELTPAGGEGDDMAVYNVDYAEAEGFCRKLTELGRKLGELPEGWEFQLPTEAQWEYACRAGTTTATAFGNKLSRKQANFAGKPYNAGEDGPALKRATKVGSYPANAWGLHDMHGNLCEWCRDWFHARLPGGTDPDLSAVKGAINPNGTVSRSRRGSAWGDDGWASRSAFRQRFEPERRFDHIGFRVVAVPMPSTGKTGAVRNRTASPTAAPIPIKRESSDSRFAPYASDPDHLWNRLHRALFVRTDRDGKQHIHTTDPLLWHGRTTQRNGAFSFGTFHLLDGESHQSAVEVLDQFLNENAERLIGDPMTRLVLQHDLWAVFDYVAWYPDEWVYHSRQEPAAIALRTRLAKVIGRLALSDSEIKGLPDNYALAVKSQQYRIDHDPKRGYHS